MTDPAVSPDAESRTPPPADPRGLRALRITLLVLVGLGVIGMALLAVALAGLIASF